MLIRSGEFKFPSHLGRRLSYAQDRGLLITVSGNLKQPIEGFQNANNTLDVSEVIGTSSVRSQINLEEKNNNTFFTVTIAIDNLTFPAYNAVKLIQMLTVKGTYSKK